jgi:hypothetical protein
MIQYSSIQLPLSNEEILKCEKFLAISIAVSPYLKSEHKELNII